MRASDQAALFGLQHFFFDLDGTLADSKADVLNSIAKAYAHLGWTYDAAKLTIGPLLPDIIATISPQLDAAQRQTVIQTFRTFYAAGKYQDTVLFPGVSDFLHRLKTQGKTLYVATNKPRKPTLEILEKLGIRDMFCFIGTPDLDGGNLPKVEVLRSLVRKFGLNPAMAVMVGDTGSDMEAGRGAGMRTMAFTGGYGIEGWVQASQPDFVVDTYRELA